MTSTLRCALLNPVDLRCTHSAKFDGTNWPTGWLRYFLFAGEVRDFCPSCRTDVLNAVKRHGHQLEDDPRHIDWFRLVKRGAGGAFPS